MKSIAHSHFFSKIITLALLTTACSFLSATDMSNDKNGSSNGMKANEIYNHLTGFDAHSRDLVAKKHENKHITLFVQAFNIPLDGISSFSFRIGVAKPNGEITWGKSVTLDDLPSTPWEVCRVYNPEHGVYSIVVELLEVVSSGSLIMTTQATNSEDKHKYLNTLTLIAEPQYVDQRLVLGKFLFNES
jgi:hypothetical protein